MDTVQSILMWIANNVFSQVPILIGLITLIGLILQRKSLEETVGGALRATLGVVILFAGIAVFITGLVSFQAITAAAFGMKPPTSTSTLAKFMADKGSSIALIMTIGYLIHLILARLFNTRLVYLTGHLMFWMSVVFAAALVESFPTISTPILVGTGAVLVGVYWTLQPLYIHPFMKRVTNQDEFGYAHTSSSAAFLGSVFGRFLGDPKTESSESLKLPKRLSFFKDVNVSSALVIGVIMLGAMAAAGLRGQFSVVTKAATASLPGMNTYFAGQAINPWIWGLLAGLSFAAGIAILLLGVRMFLAEIVPAFKGIGEKVIPGARPALDCPVVFSYAPQAVMLGFLGSTAVFLVLMAVFGLSGWFVLVPPMIMLFFPGGAAGVFGNAFGGWKGALLGGGINGLFLAVGQAVTWPMLSHTAPETATLADPDWYIVIWLVKLVAWPIKAIFGL
jgi:ascorbate PTS system EIIC component